MIWLRFIERFFIALLLGLSCVIFFAQYDQQFKHEVQKSIQAVLHEQLGCHISWHINDVGLFLPALVFDDVVMSEHSPDYSSNWSWKAGQLLVRFSWLQFLMHGTIELHITLRDVSCFSTIQNGGLPLMEHIKKFFMSESPIPIAIKDMVIEKGALKIHDADSGLMCKTDFSGSMAALPQCFKLIMYTANGTSSCGIFSLIERCEAKTTLEIPNTDANSSTVRLEGFADVMPLLDSTRMVHFSGTYRHGRGTFQVSNNDGSCCIHSLQAHNTDDGIMRLQGMYTA